MPDLKEILDKLNRLEVQLKLTQMDIGSNWTRASYSIGRASEILETIKEQIKSQNDL